MIVIPLNSSTYFKRIILTIYLLDKWPSRIIKRSKNPYTLRENMVLAEESRGRSELSLACFFHALKCITKATLAVAVECAFWKRRGIIKELHIALCCVGGVCHVKPDPRSAGLSTRFFCWLVHYCCKQHFNAPRLREISQ